MWVQISGHSSVQSSSTFGLRKARHPIYILRSKKIEQGQLLYPKIFPPIFFKIWQDNGSKSLKGCPVQLPPNTVKIRVLVLAKKLRFSRVQSSPICLYTFSSIHMSSFKTHSIKLHSLKTLIAAQSTVGAKWSFDSQKSKFLVNILFWSHNHHLINSWSWFHKHGSQSLKMSKVSIFGQLKSQLQIDQGITSPWLIRKMPSNAHFEGDDISYNSYSHS